MRLLLKVLSVFGLSSIVPTVAFAHETGETHTEPPASIDPVVAVIVVAAIAVVGFLIWKFLLKSKEKPPTKPM